VGRLYWPAERDLRVVFMGTPEFAVPCLATLVSETKVCAVVTQPERPRGRGLKPRPSPVAQFATDAGLPVLSPRKIRDPVVVDKLKSFLPDLIVVAAYGKILPASILEIPPLGCINVHASLLPRHRGAAPIAAAILAGDRMTGITIMQMNEQMDAGDIILKRELPITPDETAGSLHEKLKTLGAEALAQALEQLRGSGIEPTPQNESEATLAPMIKKEDGKIRWEEPAEMIERRIRAYDPWPSAFTTLAGKHLKILQARVERETRATGDQEPPGAVLVASSAGIQVATGSSVLAVTRLQLEGRRALAAGEFIKGVRLTPGTRLGT